MTTKTFGREVGGSTLLLLDVTSYLPPPCYFVLTPFCPEEYEDSLYILLYTNVLFWGVSESLHSVVDNEEI